MEGEISRIVEGQVLRLVKCVDVPFESKTTQTSLDIQLSVKRCPDLATAFANFCAREKLEGENAYHAEQYGMQKATVGVMFQKLPPVLMLHLVRYEYDPAQDMVVRHITYIRVVWMSQFVLFRR